MDIEKDKVKCNEYHCLWKGTKEQQFTATNPFNVTEEIVGCPECKEINTLVTVCDEPGCWVSVSCGTPVTGGYRSTCGKHAP